MTVQDTAAERARLFAMYRHTAKTEGQRYQRNTARTAPPADDNQRRYVLGYMAGVAYSARLLCPSDPTILPPWHATECTRLEVTP